MRDLKLISSKHQRYENEVPVMGLQSCIRIIFIYNSDFATSLPGFDTPVKQGFIVRIFNGHIKDMNGNFVDIMRPKFMIVVSDTGDRIELEGVTFRAHGQNMDLLDSRAYSITLFLVNRIVYKCVLHILDRGIDIEYFDFIEEWK